MSDRSNHTSSTHTSSTQWINWIERVVLILVLVSCTGMQIPTSPLQRTLQITFSAANYIFVAWITLRYWRRMLYVLTREPWFLGLLFLVVVSYFWSTDPTITWYRARFIIRTTLLIAYLGSFPLKRLLWILVWMCIVALGFSVVTVALTPAQGTHVINGALSWRGIFGHKQQFGTFASFAATIFLAYALHPEGKRNWGYLGFAASVLFVLLSRSQTGLILLLTSLVLLPLYKITKQGRYRGFLFIVALLITSTSAFLLTINLENIVVNKLGKDVTFTGRTPIWTLAWEKILERPILGYGYWGFWTSDESYTLRAVSWAGADKSFRTGDIPFHAHNGALDILLQLGVVGLIVFLISFGLLLKRVIRRTLATRSIEYFWMFQFLGMFLINNLTESMLILEPTYHWVAYGAITLALALEQSRLSRNSPLVSTASATATTLAPPAASIRSPSIRSPSMPSPLTAQSISSSPTTSHAQGKNYGQLAGITTVHDQRRDDNRRNDSTRDPHSRNPHSRNPHSRDNARRDDKHKRI